MKEVASHEGVVATFMGKPWNGDEGSGFHLHISLKNEKGENVLWDPGKPDGLSDIALHFVAGLLKHMPAVMAFLNPTINAYRRIHMGGPFRHTLTGDTTIVLPLYASHLNVTLRRGSKFESGMAVRTHTWPMRQSCGLGLKVLSNTCSHKNRSPVCSMSCLKKFEVSRFQPISTKR